MAPPPPDWPTLLRTFGTIGCLSFGGPAGQIALLHRVLVDERGWLDEAGFTRGLNLCMLLPGPEAQQLATYCGWRLRGIAGGLAAGALFILPGALVMLALALAYVSWGAVALWRGALLGVQAAVVAIIVQAVARLARRTLVAPWRWVVATGAFLATTLALAPFPVVIALAALTGAVMAQQRVSTPPVTAPEPRFDLRLAGIGLLAWLAPWLGVVATLGWDHRLAQLGRLCAQWALVSFGGAYALLALVKEAVVNSLGWIAPADLIAGLGLAETTPGPLILVVQFLGFLAGHGAPAPFPPLVAGVLAAGLAVWMLFGPSFLFILLGAPWVDRLAALPRLAAALDGLSAAVVGIIASVGLWFTLHLLFVAVDTAPLAWRGVTWGALPAPSWGATDTRAGLLMLFGLVTLLLVRLHAWQVLGLCAALGAASALMF